jgi:hypothetical protein
MTRNRVDFPQPEGPSRVRKLPRGKRQIDILERRHGAALGGEPHRDPHAHHRIAAAATCAGSLPCERDGHRAAQPTLAALGLGGVEDPGRDDILELGSAGGELLQLVIQGDLLGPHRGVECAQPLAWVLALKANFSSALLPSISSSRLRLGYSLTRKSTALSVLQRILPAARHGPREAASISVFFSIVSLVA